MRQKLFTNRKVGFVVLAVLLAFSIAVGMLFVPDRAKGEGSDLVQSPEGTSVWNGDLIAAGWGDEEVSAPDGYNIIKTVVMPDPAMSIGGTETEGDGGEQIEQPTDPVQTEVVTGIEIGSAAALAYFAHEVYADTEHKLDNITVTLTVDIDLKGFMWIPIGTTKRSSNPDIRFKGTFDGNGKTIYNLSSGSFTESIKYDTVKSAYYIEYIKDDKTAKIPFNHDNGEYAYGLFGVSSNMVVKNISLSGVKFELTDTTVGDVTFIADNVGALIGYNNGGLSVENCISGLQKDDGTADSIIKVETKANSAVGGLVGRAYGYLTAKESDRVYADITLFNCVNNIDIEYNVVNTFEDAGKVSGIMGYATFFKDCKFLNCTNKGNIFGGQFAGGIMAFFTDGTTDKDGNPRSLKSEQPYWALTIDNCDNYGNITSSNLDTEKGFTSGKTYAGGIMASLGSSTQNNSSTISTDKNYDKLSVINFYVNNCRNYGIISAYNTESKNGSDGNGWNTAGGIFGYLLPSETGESVITNCFNYGDITSIAKENSTYYTAQMGGIIGWLYFYWGSESSSHENYVSPSVRYIDLTLTGGSYGNVAGEERTDANNRNYVHGLIGNKYTYPNKNVNYIGLVNLSNLDDNLTYVNKKNETSTATLILNEDKTAVIGVNAGGNEDFEIEIPATVTEIACGAFAGYENLKQITFASNDTLTEIGDWAFAGTGISKFEMPVSVTKIGAAAFGNCKSLNNIVISKETENNIELGKYALRGANGGDGAILIVDGYDAYTLYAESVSNSYLGGVITFPVTVEYYYLENKLDKETKLFGLPYNYDLDINGEWIKTEKEYIGTTVTGKPVWYSSADGPDENPVIVISAMNKLLSEVNGNIIRLYTFKTDKKVFIARDDIVYDSTKSYDMTELNSLLHVSSDLILITTKASIVGYTDADGNKAESNDLPIEICDAGDYTVKVTDGDDEYLFTLTVARATVNLGDYSNLSWRLTDIGGTAVNNELITGTVDNRTVLYSIVRDRNAEVTVTIQESDVYTVAYEADSNIGKNVGAYTAVAYLTADNNYTFTATGINALRGVNIDVFENGTTATVSKVWYIVEMSNWLIDANGKDYSIENRIYGDTASVSAPVAYYTGDGGTISMTLYLNDALIGNNSFGVSDFDKYINSIMPAGLYRLVVTVDGVTSQEPIGEDEYTYVYHDGFTETIEFTVDKKELPDLSAIDAKLKGKTFVYAWEENRSHLYDEDAAAVVDAYLAANIPSRAGTVWADYDELYSSGFEITFNLARMQSDLYYGANDTKVSTSDADRYTVYYMLSAANYYSSIERLKDGEVRQDYCFYVVNVREIALPTVLSKVYTGETLTADISDGLYYTVKTNNGGVDVGDYDVVLTFRSPEYYMWEGQTVANKTADKTLKFSIIKANNTWTQSLGITTWIVGEYGKLELGDGEFAVKAGSLLGNVTLKLVDANDPETVLYEGDNGTKELDSVLADLNVGTYIITATVAESESLYPLNDTIVFRVYPKEGLAWWVTLVIVFGVLIIVAFIILILWKKGVFRILTGKLVLAIRTKATIDATIASVRASKVAAHARETVAEAEARDAAEARMQARLKSAEEQRNKPLEERAAELEIKAQEVAERADRMKTRADKMQSRVETMKKRVQKRSSQNEESTDSDEK